MKTRLVLISTHYSNKILEKFAKRAPLNLVLVLEEVQADRSSCVVRQKEVFDWMFDQIKSVKTPKLDEHEISHIKEIVMCFDFNIGHSGDDVSPLQTIVNRINQYETVRLHWVKDRETLREVLSSGFLPVKLFLTGEGTGAKEIPIVKEAECRSNACVQMNKAAAIEQFGYRSQGALANLQATVAKNKKTRRTHTTETYTASTYQRTHNEETVEEEKSADVSCQWCRGCVIL